MLICWLRIQKTHAIFDINMLQHRSFSTLKKILRTHKRLHAEQKRGWSIWAKTIELRTWAATASVRRSLRKAKRFWIRWRKFFLSRSTSCRHWTSQTTDSRTYQIPSNFHRLPHFISQRTIYQNSLLKCLLLSWLSTPFPASLRPFLSSWTICPGSHTSISPTTRSKRSKSSLSRADTSDYRAICSKQFPIFQTQSHSLISHTTGSRSSISKVTLWCSKIDG